MTDSSIKNDIYDTYYKDCLTINFDNVGIIFSPSQYELTSVDIDRFDILIYKVYGNIKYMDIILELNNIEHRASLSPGDIILLPAKAEIDKFIQMRR